MHSNDNLTYHYAGGIALAALKHCPEAKEYLEICVTSPGTYPRRCRWRLEEVEAVSADINGEGSFPSPLLSLSYLRGYRTDITPFEIHHPLLICLFKSTSHHAFINAYPQSTELLHEICDKERRTFSAASP